MTLPMLRTGAFFLLLALAWPALSQTDEPTPNEPLIVGTKIAPPFVIKEEDGEFSGISIELWEELARRQNLTYEFKEVELIDLIRGLEDGTLDASVAALTVTAGREAVVDFTHPFHTTGLAIAVPQAGNPVWIAVKRLFSWEFMVAIVALGGLLLAVGFVFWLTERRKNADMFGGTPAQGIGASFWWAAVTMTTVGYGDKAPVTFAGRLVALVWMFAAIILISSFTAAIATSLTVSQLETSVQGPGDLPDARVVTVDRSASAQYLDERGIGFSTRADLPTALQAVADGDFDAVVYDRPILQYLSRQQFPLQVLPSTFERQDYAIALPEGSERRDLFNRTLLTIIEDDDWSNTLQRYLGEDGN
ncbi:transporter substrate-binding domain-containing protein [Marinimicrobium agarilyticum]|uniref:transporter substrate-binding domain-containing protein n=1 Tax=Marinimicrobium agarilyticum TaxID=306546 RepID=UPI00042044D1|nr:transporter substrate-binding domain-containing protein [Marinimicrobium agarilyticum]